MDATTAVGAPAPREKLKVFISYSRRDIAFALRLVAALEARSLDVLIDTRDLPLAVEFQKELLGFIRQADTVVYVVSPDSIASPWVLWEIEQVELLSKRLAPVIARDVQAAAVPDGIRKINYVFFTGANAEGAGFEAQADALALALKTDLEWIKAHTRWGERARLWDEQGRRPAQLLRGHELEQTEAWSARQPLEAPPLTPLQRTYVAASRKSAVRRQRYWISGSALVSIFTAALAFLAYVQKQAADASAIEARHTLALSDQRKATELSTTSKAPELTAQQPGQALAYLARAIRNDPTDFGIGRRALYLMAEHPHLLPVTPAHGLPPSFAPPRAALVENGTEAGPVEQRSSDGSWALRLAGNAVQIRKAGEQAFVPIPELDDAASATIGAAFPEHSRFAAVAGGIWGEFGGTCRGQDRLGSWRGARQARVRRRDHYGVRTEPRWAAAVCDAAFASGRCRRGRRGNAAHGAHGGRQESDYWRRSCRVTCHRGGGEDDALFRRQPNHRYGWPAVRRRSDSRRRTVPGSDAKGRALFRRFLAHERAVAGRSLETVRRGQPGGDCIRRGGNGAARRGTDGGDQG
ncbi:MAG: toll/interleukin-1 receptor domain-containing protein [Hyphomicrobium sp.]